MEEVKTDEAKTEVAIITGTDTDLTDKVKTFINLNNSRKDLEKEVKEIKEQLSKLGEEIIEDYMRNEISSISTHGQKVKIGNTLYASAKAGEIPALVFELQALGLSNCVTYNAPALTSWVKETLKEHNLIDKEGNLLEDPEEAVKNFPEQIQPYLNIFMKAKLRINKDK